MKRFILIFMLIFFLFSSVSAQVMRQLDVTVDIHEDGSSDVEILFRFTEEIKEINFPFPGEINGIETEHGECVAKKEVGNVLHCEPPSPFMVGEVTTVARFKGDGLTEKQGNITRFSFDIPILWDTDEVSVSVKLPDKTILSDEVPLPTSPSGVDIGSTGRRVITSWSFDDQDPGDVIPIRVYYELTVPRPYVIPSFDYRWMGLLILVVVVGVFFIFRTISKREELVLSVLNESERIVVDLIKKGGKKDVDQRNIVSRSGFSKAKVSRIVHDLEKRGVVGVERAGRKNKISLKKMIFKE